MEVNVKSSEVMERRLCVCVCVRVHVCELMGNILFAGQEASVIRLFHDYYM